MYIDVSQDHVEITSKIIKSQCLSIHVHKTCKSSSRVYGQGAKTNKIVRTSTQHVSKQ